MKTLIASAVVVLLSACGGGDDESRPVVPSSVTYVISGSLLGSASITYQGSGGTSQSVVRLPATIGPFSKNPGDFLYIAAQKQSGGSEPVYVAVKVNGVTFKDSTSNAPYGIASASGSCCM